jgi:hypothetical protein
MYIRWISAPDDTNSEAAARKFSRRVNFRVVLLCARVIYALGRVSKYEGGPEMDGGVHLAPLAPLQTQSASAPRHPRRPIHQGVANCCSLDLFGLERSDEFGKRSLGRKCTSCYYCCENNKFAVLLHALCCPRARIYLSLSLGTCNFSLLALLLLATVVFAIGRPHVESNLHVSPCALGRTLHLGDGHEWRAALPSVYGFAFESAHVRCGYLWGEEC